LHPSSPEEDVVRQVNVDSAEIAGLDLSEFRHRDSSPWSHLSVFLPFSASQLSVVGMFETAVPAAAIVVLKGTEPHGRPSMIRQLTLVAAMGAWITTTPANAKAADNDVRCLTVSKFFAATEKDPRRKQLSVASAFFYLGRIDARLSPTQLKAELAAPSALIKQAEAAAIMNLCAKKLQVTQRSLQVLGQAVGNAQSKK
jgi:hypothetical protein